MWTCLRRSLCLLAAALQFFSCQGCSTKYIVRSPEYAKYGGEINQHTRLIQAERRKIFQIVTQEKSFKEICPEGMIVTHESPPPYQVGTLVKTRIEHIFELGWSTQVKEIVLDRKIRLRFLDGFFAGGTEIWEFDSEGEHTRVTHTIAVRPKGFIRKLVWALKVRLKHDKAVEAVFDNLEKVCEAH